MTAELINPSPVVFRRQRHRENGALTLKGVRHVVDVERELIDAEEIFEHIRDITDPEHPYTLEELNVVSQQLVDVEDKLSRVRVQFTPTVSHCSLATLIGLCIRVQLLRRLPSRFKVDIQLTPGSHSSEASVNKQLNDKERIAAALENPGLIEMVEKCLGPPAA